ncbi:MAG: hypothetical protein A2538_04010 [Candidatus Magasanikbacteria bacterium RIFOXYD2_FULL_41_14]|uniref:Uncharacterized protein n=1 Tax=Candidatus Magasanikbacteria bacterium RIFOXYD2_FULL_41_14 TaxID=1798709 RepID=A0A1F6PFX6_9BACT|nr:MAG: hypothetical protein A2538_04010 [Candidatus Magasanikbacteria bacterium RIFOXYD2_FULL_41_14]
MALEPSVLIKKSDGTFERVLLSELAKRPKKVAPVLVVKKSDEIVIEKVEAPVVASESVVKKEINIDLPKTPIVNKEPVKNIVLPTALPKAKIVLPKPFVEKIQPVASKSVAFDTKSLLDDSDLSIISPSGLTPTSSRRENQVEVVLKKLSFSVPPNFANRLRSVILLRLKDVRGESDTRVTALRSIKDGGLGLTESQATELEKICSNVDNFKKTSVVVDTNKKMLPAREGEVLPAVSINWDEELPAISAPNNSFIHPAVKITEVAQVKASTPEKVFVDKVVPVAPAQQFEISRGLSASRPSMADVVSETPTLGPLGEIKSFTLEDFRRLAPDPTQAAKRLAQKFINLKEESIILFWQASSAWRSSALYLSYVSALSKELLGAHLPVPAGMSMVLKPEETTAIINMEKELGL